MDLEYMVICDQMEEGRTGYGLMMYNGEELQVFRDLCLRAEPVLELARRCNLGNLCPEHFQEVVEDFLLDW